MKPLSVGNVVSAGLRIYRDNFKKYYRLAFIGALWSWIPIYGWAKFYTMQGLISRLAYGEITEKPETVKDANRYVKARLWSFLGAALLVALKIFLGYIVGGIVIILGTGILVIAITTGLKALFGDIGASVGSIISVIIIIGAVVLFIGYLTRLLASFFVSELPLSLEDDMNASKALKRSQELTKGYLVNLVFILLISSAISFPLWGVIFALQLLPQFIQVSDLALPSSIFVLLSYVFNTITSALIVPFWQSIKAVVYCDLRVRREGMGIDLRK